MGCRSASLVVRCDITGPITAKQRKNERKQSNGYSVSIYCVSAGSNDTLEHSRALRLQEHLQGRRPLVPMCRSVGEAGDWGCGRDVARDIFRRKKGCQDVTTVDGLESTTKSAHDRKRWKLVAV
ncbi:hypothetical protein BHE74_00053284 [Ensete ventricosum]|nr:hypothetical protein BHE74_00053284 [Ensete ventricosum]RZS25501.1 hypothetical protein BHM03_00058706 [Ensete ventricosum]